MSMTIIEFLEARIAEDEKLAQDVPPGPWNSMTEETGDGENIYYTVEAKGSYDYFADMADTGPQGRTTADYIARFDPVRILAECAAKRAIIEAHRRQDQYDDPMAWIVDSEILLLNLAAVYRSHPDYDKEWDDELSVL